MSYIQNGGGGTGAGGGVNVSLSAGNTSGTLALISSGTLRLAGGNNVTLSQNGQSITISAGGVAFSLSGNTSGALALVSSGTLNLAGGNNITLSQNGQSVTISAANSNAGTFSLWEPQPFNVMFTVSKAVLQSTFSMFPLYVPAFVSATQFNNIYSVSISSSSNSSFAAALSASLGIYTLTGSTLNLLTASSGAANVQFSNTSNNSFNSLTGLKAFTIPLTMNATPGNYWVGFVQASASTNANWATFGYIAGTANNNGFGGSIGQIPTASQGAIRGLGYYSVATAGLPSSVGLAEITGNTFASIQQLYMNFQGV